MRKKKQSPIARILDKLAILIFALATITFFILLLTNDRPPVMIDNVLGMLPAMGLGLVSGTFAHLVAFVLMGFFISFIGELIEHHHQYVHTSDIDEFIEKHRDEIDPASLREEEKDGE